MRHKLSIGTPMSELSDFKEQVAERSSRTANELADYKLHTEARLTRLEILIWVSIGLSALGDAGIRFMDSWYLLGGWHP